LYCKTSWMLASIATVSLSFLSLQYVCYHRLWFSLHGNWTSLFEHKIIMWLAQQGSANWERCYWLKDAEKINKKLVTLSLRALPLTCIAGVKRGRGGRRCQGEWTGWGNKDVLSPSTLSSFSSPTPSLFTQLQWLQGMFSHHEASNKATINKHWLKSHKKNRSHHITCCLVTLWQSMIFVRWSL